MKNLILLIHFWSPNVLDTELKNGCFLESSLPYFIWSYNKTCLTHNSVPQLILQLFFPLSHSSQLPPPSFPSPSSFDPPITFPFLLFTFWGDFTAPHSQLPFKDIFAIFSLLSPLSSPLLFHLPVFSLSFALLALSPQLFPCALPPPASSPTPVPRCLCFSPSHPSWLLSLSEMKVFLKTYYFMVASLYSIPSL